MLRAISQKPVSTIPAWAIPAAAVAGLTVFLIWRVTR